MCVCVNDEKIYIGATEMKLKNWYHNHNISLPTENMLRNLNMYGCWNRYPMMK